MNLRLLLAVSFVTAVSFSSCQSSSPTGASDVTPHELRTATSTDLSLASTSELEDFDCTHVETVRVRFSNPGYVRDDTVGLYVYFSGLPQGPKRLRIWWDNENDAVHYNDFVFEESATEIEEVYEHVYLGLARETEMLVRVELILDGLTGNCPRNRRVTVAPGSGTTTQTASVGLSVSSVNGYDTFYAEGFQFTASVPLIIQSVRVNPGGSGTLVINLLDSTFNPLGSKSFAVGPGPQQVSLGFGVSPGSYWITLDNTTVSPPGVGISFPGASYPYQIPGVISLNDSVTGFGSFFGYYYYLYDWQVTW